MPERIPFIVLGTQRSGTTLVNSTLNRYASIRSFDEAFLSKRQADFTYRYYVSESRLRMLKHFIGRERLVTKFLNQLFDSGAQGETAIGFKLMYDQLQRIPYRYPAILRYAYRNNVKVIHVTRKNVLRILLSRLIARQRKVFHSTTDEPGTMEKIYISPRWIIRRLRSLTRQQDLWKARLAEFDTLELSYEDFVARKERHTKRMLEFLRVDADEILYSPLKKVSPTSIVDIVSNYEEIVETLSGTAFMDFLDK